MFLFKNTNLSDIGKLKLAEDMQKNPIMYLLPNKPQADLAEAIGTLAPKKRIFLVTSANNTGKTVSGASILANIMGGNINVWKNIRDVEGKRTYSGFYDYPFFNNYPASA